jgi:site-specific recombinase XerD
MKLTNPQIDELCQHLVEKTRNMDVYAYILFDTLYNTGLRVNELLEYSRIEIIDTGYSTGNHPKILKSQVN